MCEKDTAGPAPQELDYASPGCGLENIADRLCDPLCMTPLSAMDGGDCLVVVSECKRRTEIVCVYVCVCILQPW